MPNKQEITWNLINSALAGALILLGALTQGDITIQAICAAVVAGLIVFITKFREYWLSTGTGISNKKGKNYIFTFI